MSAMSTENLPRWANLFALPLLNLLAAFTAAGLVLWGIGESPLESLKIVIQSAVLSFDGLQFTLFYATGFIFTGLAVALAFHAGLFNIGGEGQVYLAGLGVTLGVMIAGSWPIWLLLPFLMLMAMLFGGLWALIPAWLQAYRGSHIVVTTIMFNFIASGLMNYLITQHLMPSGAHNVSTADFPENAWMPSFTGMAKAFGYELNPSPLNLSLLIALACAALFYVVLWRSRWGYELRTLGSNPHAAHYAGVPVKAMVVLVVCASGALAGLASVNELSGAAHRMNLNFPNGIGFIGIAVALMGRNNPVGIVLSSILFGVLIQGGLELSLANPRITNNMVFFIQGLIILFSGALTYLFAPLLARLVGRKPQAAVV
jgi:ABC-type uncharacterized transport system permease subunit